MLEGSARREAGRVRISAELIHAQHQTQVWADTFERELSGIFALQSEVAKQVANALALNCSGRAGAAGERQDRRPRGLRRVSQGGPRPSAPDEGQPRSRGTVPQRGLEGGSDLRAGVGAHGESLDGPTADGHRAARRGGPQGEGGHPQGPGARREHVRGTTGLGRHHDVYGLGLAGRRTRVEQDARPESERRGCAGGSLTVRDDDGASRGGDEGGRARRGAQSLQHEGPGLPGNGPRECAPVYEAIAAARALQKLQPDATLATTALFRAFLGKGMFEEAYGYNCASTAATPNSRAPWSAATPRPDTSARRSGSRMCWQRGLGSPAAWAPLIWQSSTFRPVTGTAHSSGSSGRTSAHNPNVPYLRAPEMDFLRPDPRFTDLMRRVGLPQ